MGLVGDALAVAEDISKRFPNAKITSGRRTIAEQALAMAKNVAKDRERMRKVSPLLAERPSKWIESTYAGGRVVEECQDWVDRHPNADVSVMGTAFASIISMFPEDDQRRMSKHLTGEALDVEPVIGADGEELLKVLKDWAFRKGGRFLSSEGALIVWHWQAK